MRLTITKLLLAAAIFIGLMSTINAQTVVQTQSGSGTPAGLSVSCAVGVNIGQEFYNTAVTPNAYYICTPSGWTALAGVATTQINSATQIKWPALSGPGTPFSQLLPCSPFNYTEPYTNTAVTPNTVYTCGSDGWSIRGSAGLTGDSSIAVTPGVGGTATLHVLGVTPYAAGAGLSNQYNYNFAPNAVLTPVGTCAANATSCTFISTSSFPSAGCGAWLQGLDDRCWTGNNTVTGVLSGMTQFQNTTSVSHPVPSTNDAFVGIPQSTGLGSLTATSGNISFSNGWTEIGGLFPLAPYRIEFPIFAAQGISSPYQPIFSMGTTVGQSQTGTAGALVYPPALVQTSSSSAADFIGYGNGTTATPPAQTFGFNAATGKVFATSLYLPSPPSSTLCLHQLYPSGQIVPSSADCGTGGSPADVSTPTVPGTVNGDGQMIAAKNGTMHIGGPNTWDTRVLGYSVGTTLCGSTTSGLDCAKMLGAANGVATGQMQTYLIHAGGFDNYLNTQWILPTGNAGTNIVCDPGSTIHVNAAMGTAMLMPTGAAYGYFEQHGTCYLDLNHLATGGLVLNNGLNVKIEKMAINYIDIIHGNGNSNINFACGSSSSTACSNAQIAHLYPGAGNTGHTGPDAVIRFPIVGGALNTTGQVLQRATGITVPTPGTGGTSGNFAFTTTAGTDSCAAGRYPSGTLTVSGGGYTSGVVNFQGFACTGPNLTVAVTGSTVTGAAFTIATDTGATGYTTTADADGVINPVTPFFITGQQPNSATLPAVFQNTNSGGANYSLQQAGNPVSPITIGYNLSHQVISANLLDSSVTSVGANLVGSYLYVYLQSGEPLYALAQTCMADSTIDEMYITGGQRGLLALCGGSTYKSIHSQSPIGVEDRGGNSWMNLKLDSNAIEGLLTSNSASLVEQPNFTYNVAGNYPGATVFKQTTNNSTFNGMYRDALCNGLPIDSADFAFFSSGTGNVATTGSFAYGTKISGIVHCSTEPNLGAEIAAEQAADQAANGTTAAIAGAISGPISPSSVTTPKFNSTLYVQSTIQAAVTAACLATNQRVVILAGSTPSDTIGAVTGGCSTVPIIDERNGQSASATYTFNGGVYVAGGAGTGRTVFGQDSRTPPPLATGSVAIGAGPTPYVGNPGTFYLPSSWPTTGSGAPLCGNPQATTLDAQNNYGIQERVCVAGTDYVTPTGNISGTAAGLTGTPALPNGTTAATQTARDNSTKIATTAYVLAAAAAAVTNPPTIINTGGTSIIFGNGGLVASNQPGPITIPNILAADTGAYVNNNAVAGSTEEDAVNVLLQTWSFPPVTGIVGSTYQYPMMIADGGTNNFGICGNTTDCLNNYSAALSAFEAIVTLPPGSNEVIASLGTNSGFAADTAIPLNSSLSGTAMKTTTNGSTLSITVPAGGSRAGFKWYARSSNAGTFTATLDGTPITDPRSGSATFNSFGYGSTPITTGSTITTTAFRADYAVTAGATHTFMFTVTSATGAGNIVTILDADISPATGKVGPVFGIFPTWKQGGDANSAGTLAFYNASVAVNAAAVANGQNVTQIDPRNSFTYNNVTYPAINTATDYMPGAAACTNPADASNLLHLNPCGMIHAVDLAEATLLASNQGVSFVKAGYRAKTYSTGPYVSQTGGSRWNSNLGGVFSNSNTTSMYCGDDPASASITVGPNCVGLGYDTTNSKYGLGLVMGSGGSTTEIFGTDCPNNFSLWTSCTTKFWFDTNGSLILSRIVAGIVGTAIASATTIAPTTQIAHISGTTPIVTITAPAPMSATVGGCLTFIPDGAFTTTTTGNIAVASTAVVNKPLIECYDGAKFYPNY